MATYNITISNISGSTTPCSVYNIYTGTTWETIPTTPLFSDVVIPLNGKTFQIVYSGASKYVCVFVEHCDDHITPVPNATPKKQGSYQIRLAELIPC
jgi:hypothetical protein